MKTRTNLIPLIVFATFFLGTADIKAQNEYTNAFECADEWDMHLDSLEADPTLSRARMREEQARKREKEKDIFVVVYKLGTTTVFGFTPLHLETVGPFAPGPQHHYALLEAAKPMVIKKALSRLRLESCDWTTGDGSCIIRSGKAGPNGIHTFLDMKIGVSNAGHTEVRCGPLSSDEWQYDPDNPPLNGFECTGGQEATETVVEQGPLYREATERYPGKTIISYRRGRFRVFGLEPDQLTQLVYFSKNSTTHEFRSFFPLAKAAVISAILHRLGKGKCDEIRSDGPQPGFSDPTYADVCVIRKGTLANGNAIRGTIEIAPGMMADMYGGGANTEVACYPSTE